MMLSEKEQQLIDLSSTVSSLIATGEITADITNDKGAITILTAHESETLANLYMRVIRAGGYVNLYVLSSSGTVHYAAIVPASDAINELEAEDLSSEPPASTATIGLLLEYAATNPAGVVLPPLNKLVNPARVTAVKPVEAASLAQLALH